MPASVAAVLLCLWLLWSMAPPAAAHGADAGTTGSNFRTVFTDPGAECLQWEVLAADGYVQLRSTCPGVVTVLGYADEPYLELSVDGVRENRNSPAAYLNRDPRAKVTVPESADPSAEPDWVPRRGLPSYRWHDHRTHWMVDTPPDVQGGTTKVAEWAIPVRFDDDGTGAFVYLIEARGELWYSPPLPWWIPITAAAVPCLVVVAYALLRVDPSAVERRRPTGRALARPVVGLLGAIAVLTLIGVVDDTLQPGQSGGERLVALLVAAIVLLGGGAALWRARVGDDTGFLALVGAGFALSWAYGWEHRPLLSSSQLLSDLPDLLVRLTAALQVLAVVPAVIVAAVWRWRSRPAPVVEVPS
ncbi:MAG: hypothetical protein IT196_12990 [Acidimicrobiales bacterium]|nr:hypothetical protein [Acidimicrobiales bacterium]